VPPLDDDVSVDELREAVEHMHGVPARFVEAVEIDERFNGEVVWQGAVKVFELTGHPSGATRAYAWSYRTERFGRTQLVRLHRGPWASDATPLRPLRQDGHAVQLGAARLARAASFENRPVPPETVERVSVDRRSRCPQPTRPAA